MRFAIIGCQHAHIGIFLKEMLELGHECAGIYEQDNLQLAGRLSDTYRVPLAGRLDALLGAAVEVVGCAAVNNRKMDVVERCERHGIHVMVDKPAATDEDGLRRLRAVTERGRIQVGMLLTERFRPSVVALKRLIDGGELGRLVQLQIRKPHRLNPAERPAWHFDPAQSGGIVVDLLVHDFDLLRWLTGSELLEVSGFKTKRGLPEYPQFYDAASAQALLADGTTAQLYADWHTPAKSWTWGDCRIFVSGTRGSAEVRLEGDPLIAQEELLLAVTDAMKPTRVALPPADATVTEDFMLRLSGGASRISAEDVLAATAAALRADRCMRAIGGGG